MSQQMYGIHRLVYKAGLNHVWCTAETTRVCRIGGRVSLTHPPRSVCVNKGHIRGHVPSSVCCSSSIQVGNGLCSQLLGEALRGALLGLSAKCRPFKKSRLKCLKLGIFTELRCISTHRHTFKTYSRLFTHITACLYCRWVNCIMHVCLCVQMGKG